jgi:hypothetical protein
MSKTLLYNNKNKENKQFKISEVLAEEQQQVKEKEFIILKICFVARFIMF